MRILILCISAVFTAVGQPANQNIDRVWQFKHTDSKRGLEELATVVRSITEVSDATVDVTQRTFRMHASAGKIAVAEWLFNLLDQPLGQKTTGDFSMEGGDLVRVFRLTATNQEFHEIMTVVRSTGKLRRMFAYGAGEAVALRGSAADLALATWLLHELDQPTMKLGALRVIEYKLQANDDDAVQVLYLAHVENYEQLNELATYVRNATRIPQLFFSNARRAIIVRGTSAQLARAAQLIEQRDR